MRLATTSELVGEVETISRKGARPLSIRMACPPPLLKYSREDGRACPYYNVVKRSYVSGMLNFVYERSVNRQRVREEKPATFTSEANWFVHLPTDPRAIVSYHEDHSRKYLQVKSQRAIVSRYYNGDGTPIDFADVREYLPHKTKPKKQQLDHPVYTFTVSLANIVSLSCDGETFAVVHALEPQQIE